MMHSRFTIPTLIAFLFVITTGLYAQEGIRPPDAYELHGLVDDILTGTHQKVTKASISQNSVFIDGASEQDLYQALFGTDASNTIKLERNRKVLKRRLGLSADSKAGFVIVTTVAEDRTQPRVHSVYFSKSDKGDWMIWSWHTSN